MKEDISLRDYIEAILDSHDRAHAAEHKAVELAAQEMERRVEGLNELRKDVITDRGQFVRRDMLDGLITQNEERLAARDEKAAALAAALEDATAALAKAIDERIKPLEQQAVTKQTVDGMKKVLYGFGLAVLLSFGLALFNLITHAGS